MADTTIRRCMRACAAILVAWALLLGALLPAVSSGAVPAGSAEIICADALPGAGHDGDSRDHGTSGCILCTLHCAIGGALPVATVELPRAPAVAVRLAMPLPRHGSLPPHESPINQRAPPVALPA